MRRSFWVIHLVVSLPVVASFVGSTRTRRAPDTPHKVVLYSTQQQPPNLVARQNIHNDVHVLSRDPLVYTIPNLLSAAECQALQDYVQELPADTRPLTRSNPPAVSLDGAKLWPALGVLSLLAGVPPVYRLYEAQGNDSLSLTNVVLAGVPNVLLAAGLSAVLAYAVVLPLLRARAASSARTSDAVALNQAADYPVIQPLVDRIAAQTTHAWSQWEAPVVTRYAAGAVFGRHGDASPSRGSEWQHVGGQRVVTCICYLQTLSSGGETYFDQLDVAVQPVAGTALIFFPADSQTWQADERTTHESLPPVDREKWIVQMFGRAQRVPPPLGLPDSYGENKR